MADQRITLVLPTELLAKIDQVAARQQRSRAGEMRHALSRHVDQVLAELNAAPTEDHR